MKNEALRLFLAMMALILTALLANPMSDKDLGAEREQTKITQATKAPQKIPQKNVSRKIATERKSHATRSFAFFYRR